MPDIRLIMSANLAHIDDKVPAFHNKLLQRSVHIFEVVRSEESSRGLPMRAPMRSEVACLWVVQKLCAADADDDISIIA